MQFDSAVAIDMSFSISFVTVMYFFSFVHLQHLNAIMFFLYKSNILLSCRAFSGYVP